MAFFWRKEGRKQEQKDVCVLSVVLVYFVVAVAAAKNGGIE